ncbi:hypothetical protein HDU86_007486 [Geranomyces michiganensis]|nr:hypothetical protein HDU86_007486 [Geranomyces michiganensis]
MDPPGDQVVLEEEFDENYEPTDEEIIDYAKFLGIDPDTEQNLLWIARQSLKAPLPPNWKPCQTADGKIYYFNFTTGESIWDHPCDEHYKRLYAEEKAKSVAARVNSSSGNAVGKDDGKPLLAGGGGGGHLSAIGKLGAAAGGDKVKRDKTEALHHHHHHLPALGKAKLAALPTITLSSSSSSSAAAAAAAAAAKSGGELEKKKKKKMLLADDDDDDDDDEDEGDTPVPIPRVDSEDEISLPRPGDKSPHDWDAVSDEDDDGEDDDARIIDSVLRGKDPARNLNLAGAAVAAASSKSSQQQKAEVVVVDPPLGERKLKHINEDDDFDLSLSSNSDRLMDHPQPLITTQRRDDHDRLDAEEKRIFDTTAREIRAKWEAELRALEQVGAQKLETEKQHLAAQFAEKKQLAEREETKKFSDAVDALRAKYREQLAEEEATAKRELERTLGELKRGNAEKLLVAKREEESMLARDIETARHRHETQVAQVADEYRQKLEQHTRAERDALDRALRDLKHENADTLARETERHETELRDMRRAFETRRADAEREYRAELEVAERRFRDRLEHTVDDKAIAEVVGRAEDEHRARVVKLKQKHADAESDARADLERQSAARLRALKDELDAKETAQRKKSEARIKEHEAKEMALKQQLDIKLRDLERELGAKETAKRKELNDRSSRNDDVGKTDAVPNEEEDSTIRRRAASLNARKTELDRLERELDEREDTLRARSARTQRQSNRNEEDPPSEDHQQDDVAEEHRHRHKHRHDKRDRSAHRSSSRSPRRVQMQDALLARNDDEVPRSMLRDLAAEVLSAAGLDTGLAEDVEDGEDPLRFLYSNTNVDSDSDEEGDIDVLSRATQRSDFRRSQSPSTLLATRLRSEEAQIQHAKQFLRRQQKHIGARQKELSLAQQKWKKEIAEISSHLQRGGVLNNGSLAQRADSLDEIEGELGKLLGALKASISSNRGVAADDDARIAIAQRATSLRTHSRGAPTARGAYTTTPLMDSAPDVKSATVSQHRKRAWEVGHSRTEERLAEHNAWLKGFMARHSSVLSR